MEWCDEMHATWPSPLNQIQYVMYMVNYAVSRSRSCRITWTEPPQSLHGMGRSRVLGTIADESQILIVGPDGLSQLAASYRGDFDIWRQGLIISWGTSKETILVSSDVTIYVHVVGRNMICIMVPERAYHPWWCYMSIMENGDRRYYWQ